MHMIRIATLLLATSALAVAQQPKVVNSQLRTEAAGAGLPAAMSQLEHETGPLWVGYEVSALPRAQWSCWGDGGSSTGDDSCCGEYRLEGSDNSVRNADEKAETAVNVDVLLRVENGAVMKIRSAPAGCQLNAGGLPFVWLTGVQPEESAAYLGSVAARGDEHLADAALAVLSEHATAKATSVLASFTSSTTPLHLREKAAFWLGSTRGHDGFVVLERLARGDQDADFRKKLTFDLSVSKDPAAIDELIRMAGADADEKVREQALFWVAQKAGAKAVATLQNAVKNDPDVAVKRKAVFALSRLPNDQAVPQLLEVAQTNSDPVIRKEAMFWLAQTHDPRALEYFETILQH